MLMDIQCPSDAYYGKFNVLAGCRSDLVVTLPASGALVTGASADVGDVAANVTTAVNNGTAPFNAAKLSAQQINSGILIIRNNNATTLGNGEVMEKVRMPQPML